MATQPKQKRMTKQNLPDPLPNGFVFKDLHKRTWSIKDRIGSGGFGIVYAAKFVKDESSNPKRLDGEFVVKTEYHQNGPLFTEIHFYLKACKEDDIAKFVKQNKLDYVGMPPCISTGSFEHDSKKYRYLIMERYGTDLQQILNRGSAFNIKTTYTIAMSLLYVIEYIHSCGYSHGDIKGANLLLGKKKGTENRVYLVDMGLALKYISDGVHKTEVPDKKKMHNGTIEFTSRDNHRGTPGTRRSDLEILGYNLIHWLSLKLPWVGSSDCAKAHKMKEDFMGDLAGSLKRAFHPNPVPSGLTEFLNYVVQLEFDEEPDYNLCRKFFVNGAKKFGVKIDGKLDFTAESSKGADHPSTSSAKENNVKKPTVPKAVKPRTTKKDVKTISVDPSLTLTPAMLDVLNKRKAN